MDEEMTAASPRRANPIRGLVVFALICFAIGIAAMGWILSEWQPVRDMVFGPQATAPQPPVAKLATVTAPPVNAEAHMARIEQRLAIIDQQADNASNDAARAERLMIAFAARRAVERGTPLGYLEGALQRQFGASDAAAVATVIDAARRPVTLEQLEDGLEATKAELASGSAGAGWFASIWQDVSTLAVVHRPGESSKTPSQRLEIARRALERDRVETAMREIRSMPGAGSAKPWLVKAQRYVAVRKALDRLEAITLSVAPSAAE